MATIRKRRPTVIAGTGKLSKSGQVSVPADVRKELGAEPGDRLLFSRNKNGEFNISKQLTVDEVAGILGPADPEDVEQALQEARHYVRRYYRDDEEDESSIR